MHKILVIASREFRVAVQSKAFVISLISMPIFMVGSIVAQMVLKEHEDKGAQKYAIVDRSAGGEVAQILKIAASKRNETQLNDPKTGKQIHPAYEIEVITPETGDLSMLDKQRLEISNRVREGQFLGFLEVGTDIFKPSTAALPVLDNRGRPLTETKDSEAVRYQTNTPLDDDFPNWARAVVNAVVMQKRANASGVSLQAVTDALRPVPLLVTRLTKIDPLSGSIVVAKEENRMVNFLIPLAFAMLMFMMILVGTTPLLNSVLEEKLARIAEVLLGSVTPFQLMAGKLIGMVGVSLVGMAIYLGGAYYAAHRYGLTDYVPLSLIAWFVFFQILGVLMFGSLFIAIGAASTDAKESQTLVTPVMMLATLPFFVMAKVIEQPNSSLATWMSFFPFATPSLMVMRLSVPPGIPWWQPWAGMAVVVASSTFCIWAASRVFRVGLLMQGKGANFAQMARWVIKG